jgi:hypothetical protein
VNIICQYIVAPARVSSVRSLWVAVLNISPRNGRQDLGAPWYFGLDVRLAVVCVEGLYYTWDEDPERGLRAMLGAGWSVTRSPTSHAVAVLIKIPWDRTKQPHPPCPRPRRRQRQSGSVRHTERSGRRSRRRHHRSGTAARPRSRQPARCVVRPQRASPSATHWPVYVAAHIGRARAIGVVLGTR